jgi:hypothetical protein
MRLFGPAFLTRPITLGLLLLLVLIVLGPAIRRVVVAFRRPRPVRTGTGDTND